MSYSKVIRDEIYKMSFYKVSKTRFFTEKESRLEEVFLSVCFPQSGLSFEYFHFSSTRRRTEKIEK
jgi:hypothetical protein